jgi:MFS family permease
VLLTGLLVGAAGLTILGVSTQVDGTYLGVLGGLFPMSVGLGATFVSLTLVATTNVDENDAGLASGLFNTSQQVGGALGLAILSTLANDRTTNVLGDVIGRPTQAQLEHGLVEGYQLAFFVAAGLLALGAVLLGLLLRERDVARIDAGDVVPLPA